MGPHYSDTMCSAVSEAAAVPAAGSAGVGDTWAGDRQGANTDPVHSRDGGVIRNSITATRFGVLAAFLLLTAAFLWAYWPTLNQLVATWNRHPDYSHGFLVPILAAYFCWARRDRLPVVAGTICWFGLVLLAAGVAMRLIGAHYYLSINSLDGWSIMFWLGGVVWLLAGGRVFWWSLPAVAFLVFMVPLPFSIEQGLSRPLQTIATRLSCWALQMLGQPALAEGHVIVLGEQRLEVEYACSGLRIFVGIMALAFAYVVLMRQSWWERTLLLLSAIPIALVSNATRIVGTGLLYQYASGEAARRFSHDMAGWVMIIFAAGLFALVLWYLRMLAPEVETVDVATVMRGQQTRRTGA